MKIFKVALAGLSVMALSACPIPINDSCSPSYCSSHGVCKEANFLPSCECAPGYEGLTCNTCSVGFHREGSSGCAADEECTPESCSGHGSCSVVSGVVSCECAAGYSGPSCGNCYGDFLAMSLDGGDVDGGDADAGFECVAPQRCNAGSCAPGFTCNDSTGVLSCICDGPGCQTCETGSCGAHGVCDDSSGSIRCTCETGYQGASCSSCYFGFSSDDAGTTCIQNQTCAVNSCSGGGVCSTVAGAITCACDAAYAGADCETCATGFHRDVTGRCVVDEVCGTNSCPVHSTCAVTDGAISCACDVGYAGQTCSNCYPGYHRNGAVCELDAVCLATSCGRGVCEDGTGVVQCSQCPTGFSGAHCEVNNDDCGTACNSGRCVDLVGARVCLCTDGTYGQSCLPGPTVTSITPSSGTLAGGYPVTLVGTLFSGSTTVTFDGSPITVTGVTATTLTFTVPAGRSVGAKSVVVRNPNNQRATVSFNYTPFSFAYTGANQSFTVPTGVTSLSVRVWGAAGGGGNGPTVVGGAGGFVTGTLAVTSGQVLTVVVGQGGAQVATPSKAGAGGGYSGVFLGAVSQANALVIAGGGGGGGFFTDGQGGSSGGNGGGDFGGDGAGSGSTSFAARGLGGSLQAGGVGGCSTNAPNGQCGQNGSALKGGGGGVQDLSFNRTGATFGGGGGVGASTSFNSGGGGGGYFGGGGGANDTALGGGGGSGYVAATVTNGNSSTSGTAGVAMGQTEVGYVTGVGVGGNASQSANGGNGLVLISW